MKMSTLGLTATGIRPTDTITGTGATGRGRRTLTPSGWFRATKVGVTMAATGKGREAALNTTITGTTSTIGTATAGATTIITTTENTKAGTKRIRITTTTITIASLAGGAT